MFIKLCKMESFIKKIFLGKIDKQTHSQFVRFGKGVYRGRALISINRTSSIKVKASSEYANELVELAAEISELKFSGKITSQESLGLENEGRKQGLYVYEVLSINSKKIQEIKEKVYYMLLDAENNEIILKIKKKLPKPGKGGEAKMDDRFCILECDLKYWEKIKEAFFWDVDGKKIKISHVYNISEIVIPEGEKDFNQVRLKAKRKGRIIRNLNIDDREETKEIGFEA